MRRIVASSLALAVGLAVCPLANARHTSQTPQAPNAETESQQDPVLTAMLAEMDRSKKQLQLQDFQRPFFLQYRLDDIDDYETAANYGAITGDKHDHRRLVRVTVRVGDYKTDSSMPHGDGTLQVVSIDNDPLALRIALWSATDLAYKAALRDYTQKQVALKGYQTQPFAQDFSWQQPITSISPLARLDLNTANWQQRITQASDIYHSRPAFEKVTEYSSAGIHARAVNRYLVNSEGTVVRQGSSAYQATIAVGTQATDGMHIDRSYNSTATSAAQLDSPAIFNSHVEQLIASLEELRNAPVVDEVEYHGPVLFSGELPGRFLKNCLRQRLLHCVPIWGPKPAPRARILPAIARVCCQRERTLRTIRTFKILPALGSLEPTISTRKVFQRSRSTWSKTAN